MYTVGMLGIFAALHKIVGLKRSDAQNVLSTINAYNIAIFGTYVLITNKLSTNILWHVMKTAKAYFVVDTILCIVDRTQWIYIPHHIFALIITMAAMYGYASVSVNFTRFVIYIEYSNLLLPFWDYFKNYKLYTFFVSVTYIPIRSIVLPIYIGRIMNEISSEHSSIIFKGLLMTPFAVIQAISWIHSITVYKHFKAIIFRHSKK